MHTLTKILLIPLLLLTGCNPVQLMEKMVPKEDDVVAKNYITNLRSRDFESIEKVFDPSIKVDDLHGTLIKMAELIPSGEPSSIKLVGVNINRTPKLSTTNLSYEYEFPGKWLVINVAIQKREGISTIIGFHVYPLSDSLENQNRFTLSGKSILQYLTLTLSIIVPLIILYALILCVRTKMSKRKWLWILFILLGIGKFSINWTTGTWAVEVLVVQLLGVGAFAPPYGAWLISISLPVGAAIFLLRRNRLLELPDTCISSV